MSGQLHFAACSAVLLVAGVLSACEADGPIATPMAGAGVTAGVGAAGMGMTAGTSAAGTAAAGSGASGTGALTCATAKKGTPAELHAAAALALLPTATNKGCAFTSCHDMSSKKAGLSLLETPNDLRAQLVGKVACEVPAYQLVDATGGDMALAKSWLWQKFVAPAGSDGQLVPKPEWGTPVTTCGQEMGFGLRMPRSQSADLLTPQSKLEAVRDWICAGAPGPT
jgi:hypothetical protein